MLLVSTFLLLVSCLIVKSADVTPEQVHLSLAKDPASMVVTWVTFESADSEGKLGETADALSTTVEGTQTRWDYNGSIRYIHRVTFTKLKPDFVYYYQVGGSGAYSQTFDFHTFPAGNDFAYRICVFGDLGVFMGYSTDFLLAAAANHEFDLIIHIGDIAYDLHTDDGKNGDVFMRTLEPMVARIPYMVIAGNHEDDGRNFSNYVNRFTMPDEGYGDNQFYSVDVGPIHWQGVSTEYYGFYYIYGWQTVLTQYDWLKQDLAAANGNRKNVPWVINFMHRPFYCSNDNTNNCVAFENRMIRLGWLEMPGLEDLFTESGVDAGFWGHEHSYERFYPVANGVYYNSSDAYNNAKAPVWIISGAAGCHSGHAWFSSNPLPYSAARVNDYGYTIVHVQNKTHLYFEQISVEKNTTVDSFWLTKDLSTMLNTERRARSTDGIRFSVPERSCHARDLSCRLELMDSNRLI